jgi:GGDEF domain-containing protein
MQLIGVAAHAEHGEKDRQLLRHADEAMYASIDAAATGRR